MSANKYLVTTLAYEIDQLKAEVIRLRWQNEWLEEKNERICKIAKIAHYGQARGMGEGDILAAIRELTVDCFRHTADQKSEETK